LYGEIKILNKAQ